ncbi:hypothetical protein [Sutcliffiella halmapala]|uniref:hypothetical protein n=1 Tax=Sutcliffiella halmapala TaxID=79882 RepID=UPI00099540D3|nr:hypothetical protein [Sutcliffiella halmapala]
MFNDEQVQEAVVSLLEIIVILQLEENPILGIVFIVLFKFVTHDIRIRLLFILLVVVLGVLPGDDID